MSSALMTMANVRNHSNWLQRFNCLVEYTKEHGHCVPPRSYATKDGFNLGIWASEQRKRREKHSTAETRLLEGLPGWTWNASNWKEIRN